MIPQATYVNKQQYRYTVQFLDDDQFELHYFDDLSETPKSIINFKRDDVKGIVQALRHASVFSMEDTTERVKIWHETRAPEG